MDVPEPLVRQIIEYVKSVPRGKVVSYGQIASQVGMRDARVIGWALHSAGGAEGVPWWRVLNNEGKLTIKEPAGRMKQKELLMAEGVEVNEGFALDMEKYRHGTVPGQKKLL